MINKHNMKRLDVWTTPVLLIAILIIFTVLVTIFGDKSLARMAAQTSIRVTFVVGLWIFVGNSGLISFGHAGFMAIGAYGSAWLTLRPQMKSLLLPGLPEWLAEAQWPHLPATITSGLLAAFVALLLGLAILRLSGIAASIATFAFLAIVNTVYSNWEGVTGATSSVVGLDRYADQWVTLGWASAAVIAAAIYANSASGLALRASREDEVAASASGIDMYRHRLLSLVISAFFTGVSGVLLGHSLGVLSPNSFYLGVTFITLAMLVVGGIGSLTGAVAGVMVLSIAIEALVRMERGASIGGIEFALPTGAQEIVIGIVMIVVLIRLPNGLTGGRELRRSLFTTLVRRLSRTSQQQKQNSTNRGEDQ